MAQDATENTFEDIVVTAQRSEARLQDVPVAVTAFNAETLETAGIANVEDVAFHTPNVQMREESGVGGLTIAIRGINVSAENFSFDTAVGVYMNEVFIARSNDFNASFYDVSRVQVLRGPQGTLFGRNTPAGAVLIETARPGNEFGGYVEVSGGAGGGDLGAGADRDFYRVEGAIDLPVSEVFAMRLAGFYENDTGWARSAATGYENNSRDDYALRLTSVLRPTNNFEASLVLDHSEFERGVALHVPVQLVAGTYQYDALNGGTTVRDQVAADIADGIDPYATNHELNGDDYAHGHSSSAALTVTYDFSDNVRLRSITGWRDIERTTANESDGTIYQSAATPSYLQQTQFSQEFVLSVDVTEKLNLLAGLFYFIETGEDQNTILYNVANPGLPTAFVDPLLLRGEDFENTSEAIFASISYDITPDFTIRGGVRHTQEEKYVFVNSYRTVSGTILARGPESFSDEVTLFDVGAEFRATDDVLLYAKWGTGYRAGGIGFRAADAQFQPEEVETIELGIKSDFMLGSMAARLNGAIFHTIYENYQVPVVLTGPTRQTVVNAGGALIDGIELEFRLRATDNLTFEASAGLLNARYDEFVFNNVSLGGLINLTGNELRGTPDTTLGAAIMYELPSSIGEWLFRVDYAWRSDHEVDTVFQSGAPVVARTDVFHQDAFGILNARVRLAEAFGSNVDISLWGKNLTDEQYIVYGLHSAPTRMVVFSEPRSYGLQFRANF